MQQTLRDEDWELLLARIRDGKCTPFLGAGACSGVLPLSSAIAEEWAKRLDYPLDDDGDLARVAQFLAVKFDPMHPKESIIQQLKQISPPDFHRPGELHGILADLPLPLYITTNYDDFMYRALLSRNKSPRQEVCRWNKHVKNKLRAKASILRAAAGGGINASNPVVFHLHGHTELAESIVLTEDDYLDFLVNISRDEDLIPPRVQEAMAGTSLLFLGYRLADWSFRVLFRSLVSYLERTITRAHVSVQLVPVRDSASDMQRQKAQEYLQRYFGKLEIRVYWGTCHDFAAELRGRWEEHNAR